MGKGSPKPKPLNRAEILRTALTGLVGVDALFERLVFKGGNAIDWFYGGSGRASKDLDFSIDRSVTDLPIEKLEMYALQGLPAAFEKKGLHVFALQVREVPEAVKDDLRVFWGGYKIEFKLVMQETWENYQGRESELSPKALTIDGPGTIEIDLSRHEHCDKPEVKDVDGYAVNVYPVALIVAEKFRALCQQTQRYCDLLERSPRARAQDFFDIRLLIERHSIDVEADQFLDLARAVFDAKRVDGSLLKELEGTRELHRPDYVKLSQTVSPGVKLLSYDEYFDGTLSLAFKIHARWEVNPPL